MVFGIKSIKESSATKMNGAAICKRESFHRLVCEDEKNMLNREYI